jgi:hypothetical protein
VVQSLAERLLYRRGWMFRLMSSSVRRSRLPYLSYSVPNCTGDSTWLTGNLPGEAPHIPRDSVLICLLMKGVDPGICRAAREKVARTTRGTNRSAKRNPRGYSQALAEIGWGNLRSSFRGFRPFHKFPDNSKNREHDNQIR